MLIEYHSIAQAKYKASPKGQKTQSKYYKSEAKRLSAVRDRQKNPARSRAMSMVYYAVKTGKLIKLDCRFCHKTPTQAHHEDYSKPLEVLWLCTLHHKERHQWINLINREVTK